MFEGLNSYTHLVFLTVLLSILVVTPDEVDGLIVANFVLPHGGIALDPTYFNTTNATSLKQAWEIHHASVQAGKDITALHPDLIFLVTPHGIMDLNDFQFYMNPTGAGFADTDNCQCPPCCYNTTVNVDVTMTKEMVQFLKRSHANVSALNGFGPPGKSGMPFPLRWGEVIPFHFIPKLNSTKVAILSIPSRRYSQDFQMIPELLELGNKLYQILEQSKKRVVVISSTDLAHTHQASSPFGYSNASEPFDLACGEWATSLSPKPLLKVAASLLDDALSCGYLGLTMLHGIMEAADLSSWKPKLFVNHHPSYYGMMVASFLRKDPS